MPLYASARYYNSHPWSVSSKTTICLYKIIDSFKNIIWITLNVRMNLKKFGKAFYALQTQALLMWVTTTIWLIQILQCIPIPITKECFRYFRYYGHRRHVRSNFIPFDMLILIMHLSISRKQSFVLLLFGNEHRIEV